MPAEQVLIQSQEVPPHVAALVENRRLSAKTACAIAPLVKDEVEYTEIMRDGPFNPKYDILSSAIVEVVPDNPKAS